MLAVMPGTLLAVAAIVVGLLMPGAVVAMAAVLGAELTPRGVVAVAAMMAVVVLMPGAVVAVAVAVAAVVVRNEDEGVPGTMVPMSLPAGTATRVRPLVARTMSRLLVQHPVKGSRGSSKENRLAGREVMAALAAVALSLTGERRVDAESKHCEQGRDQGR